MSTQTEPAAPTCLMTEARGWPLERVLTAFVGANQLLYVAVGECPASIVLQRVFHVERRVAS